MPRGAGQAAAASAAIGHRLQPVAGGGIAVGVGQRGAEGRLGKAGAVSRPVIGIIVVPPGPVRRGQHHVCFVTVSFREGGGQIVGHTARLSCAVQQ